MCCICFLYMPIIQKEENAKCAATDYLGCYTGGGVCIMCCICFLYMPNIQKEEYAKCAAINFFIRALYRRRSLHNVLQLFSLHGHEHYLKHIITGQCFSLAFKVKLTFFFLLI